MADVIIVLIILAILAFSICYIVKEKKKGYACIGCPNARFIRQADGTFICLP